MVAILQAQQKDIFFYNDVPQKSTPKQEKVNTKESKFGHKV